MGRASETLIGPSVHVGATDGWGLGECGTVDRVQTRRAMIAAGETGEAPHQ
jgi:hypothetical protein